MPAGTAARAAPWLVFAVALVAVSNGAIFARLARAGIVSGSNAGGGTSIP